MKKPAVKSPFLLFLNLGILLCGAIPAFSEYKSGYHTYLDVKIDMERTLFKLNEPIEGKVIIINTGPATLPGSFTVELFKEDELKFTTTTYIKTIFLGQTDFAFKNFGIPKFNDRPNDVGRWRLVIYPSNRDAESGAQKDFEIEK